ncbi:MAG: anthranilate phosphoribosyltransferase [Candidatus Thermoplasmatota archaeon]
MIREAIAAAVERKDLDTAQARAVMTEIMSGSATPSQIAAFITACRMKGETVDELTGFALAMREGCAKVTAPPNAVDLCGTGGDGCGTFNISTVASFIVASCGVPVAKHGNRSVSSMSGSADLLDALGVPHDLDPASVQACMDATGFGFMFAPVFHPSMRNVAGPRREVGIRSLFNVLGPLANPAGVRNQLMGVYDPDIAAKAVAVLSRLGVERALVVSGSGTDEISNCGPTQVSELMDGGVSRYELSPSDFGLGTAEPHELAVGSAMDSARVTMSVLRGRGSPCLDAAVMNAAAGVYVSGAARDLDEGLSMAIGAVRSGRALEKLRQVSGFARAEEVKRQMAMQASALRSRRVLPAALKARASELTSALVEDVGTLEGGTEGLGALEPRLVSAPSVLSVITLSRLCGVLSGDGTPARTSRRGAVSFARSLSCPGVSVIGEYKPRSPSSDGLYVPPDPAAVAEAYGQAGVSAVSVLVEDRFFGGSPGLFSLIRERTQLPMLFKDFVVTEEQLDMAGSLGADAVLLIAGSLRQEALDGLIESSLRRRVEPMVEVHDIEDVRKLESCRNFERVRVVGVNSRDLRTLRTDASGLDWLRESLPSDALVVAESGIRDGGDVRSMKGFDAVLVGSALMESEDILRKAEELVSAGRGVSS